MNELIIAGVTIIQDEHGRYNLNALHQASDYAADPTKAPNQWTRRKSTRALVGELESQTAKMQLETVHGGAINDTLPGWLKRNQAGLSLVPEPSATRDKDA